MEKYICRNQIKYTIDYRNFIYIVIRTEKRTMYRDFNEDKQVFIVIPYHIES